MKDRILLGTIVGCGLVYLEKHSWDCDWYWGFGYIGNKRCHFHIDSLINVPSDNVDVNTQFTDTWLNQDQWWILRDLFIQAYAIKEAAYAYRLGGHQTDNARSYRVSRKGMESMLNSDLSTLLDTIWNLIDTWYNKANK